jgi:hypothetical protein
MSELDSFRRILLYLGTQGQATQDVRNPRSDALFSKLFDVNFPLTQVFPDYVDDSLAREKRIELLVREKYIQLRPIPVHEGILLPRLSLDADFRTEPGTVKLNVMTFLLDAAGELRAVSIRFEPPEGRGGGQHDFFHAQFMPMFNRRYEIPGFPQWFPDSKLSFPIDAKSALELLTALVVHLYTALEIHEMNTRGLTEILPIAEDMLLGRRLYKPKDEDDGEGDGKGKGKK